MDKLFSAFGYDLFGALNRIFRYVQLLRDSRLGGCRNCGMLIRPFIQGRDLCAYHAALRFTQMPTMQVQRNDEGNRNSSRSRVGNFLLRLCDPSSQDASLIAGRAP